MARLASLTKFYFGISEMRIALTTIIILALTACTENYENQKTADDFQGATILISRTLFNTGTKDICALELGIEINSTGRGEILWFRPEMTDEPWLACYDENPKPLARKKFQLSKHQLKRVYSSIARLDWPEQFLPIVEAEKSHVEGCGIVMDARASHTIWAEKNEEYMGFSIQRSCQSRNLGSAIIDIDNAIRFLPINRNLLP